MLKKGKKLYSILKGVCPKCHNESMYVNANAYNLSETLKMHERCASCNTKYKIEPSFFEITVGMAFEYFAIENCYIAIIEYFSQQYYYKC